MNQSIDQGDRMASVILHHFHFFNSFNKTRAGGDGENEWKGNKGQMMKELCRKTL